MKATRTVVTVCAAVLLVAGTATAQPVAYVTNHATNVVHMIRTSDWTPIGQISVGNGPTGIAIPQVGGFALVANKASNSVSRIDIAASSVSATIPVPGNPTSIAVTPDGSKAYVVQSTNCPAPEPEPTPTPEPEPSPTPPSPPCTVAVIDTASNTVVGTVTVGREPFAIAMSSSGGFAYVTNRADDSVSVIDTSTDTVVTEFQVGDTPEGVAAGAGVLYVTNDAANSVSVFRELDLQPITTIEVGAGPIAVAVSPDGRRAVVGNDPDGTVSIIDTSTQTVLQSLTVGQNPAGIAITPNSGVAVVANSTSGTVSVVPLRSGPGIPGSTLTIPVLGSPAGVAVSPAPYFAIEKQATPEVLIAGGTVTYAITYMNLGSGPGLSSTLIDVFPSTLSLISATGGGFLAGPGVVWWTLGTVPPGAIGTLEATFQVASPPLLADGDVITNTATIFDSAGNTASAELTAGTRVPGGLGLIQGNYNRVNAVKPRDTWRFKSQIPELPGGFDNDKPVTITWSTSTQVITTFTIPAGAWRGRSGRNRFNYTVKDLIGPGSRVRAQFVLRANGIWRLNVVAANQSLPIITDSPPEITITAQVGDTVLSSTRVFRERKTSRPGTQRLSYRSVIAGE